jgi:hypothetical protein
MKAPRWTRAQYLEHCKRTGVVAIQKAIAKARGQTKTEEAFALRFAFEHPSCSLFYEAIKLRIDATCWYTPDYFSPELMTVYEVKGPHIFEDSVIKFKAARAIHKWLAFEMWQYRNGVWREIRKLPEGAID